MVRVQYLESTGTQWLDTGVVPRGYLRVTLRFSGYSFAAQGGTPWFFGSRTAYGVNGCGAYYDGSHIFAASGAQQLSETLAKSALESAGVHTLTVNLSSYGGLYLDGTRRVAFGTAANKWTTPTNAVTVLRMRLSETGLSAPPCRLRMHRFVIADTISGVDTPLHDWVAVCIGGVAAMYDTIGGGLLYNEGTGDDFAIGPDIN
jgi:hypothetical protein